MARGGYGRGSGVPLAERRRVDRPDPAPAPPPGPHHGKHCWVTDPTGDTTPGLLVEWRRTPAGSFEGLVVCVTLQRSGRPAVVHAWMPAEVLTPRTG